MWKKGSGLYLFATFSSEHLHLPNPCLVLQQLWECVSQNQRPEQGLRQFHNKGVGVSNHLLSNAPHLLTKHLFRFWFMEVLGHRIRMRNVGYFCLFTEQVFHQAKDDWGKSARISSSKHPSLFSGNLCWLLTNLLRCGRVLVLPAVSRKDSTFPFYSSF